MKKCDQRGCTKQNRILSRRCAVGLSADISTASAPAYPRLGGVLFSGIIIPWLPCEVVNGFWKLQEIYLKTSPVSIQCFRLPKLLLAHEMQRLADTRCLHSFHSLTSLRRSPTKHDAENKKRVATTGFTQSCYTLYCYYSWFPRGSQATGGKKIFTCVGIQLMWDQMNRKRRLSLLE